MWVRTQLPTWLGESRGLPVWTEHSPWKERAPRPAAPRLPPCSALLTLSLDGVSLSCGTGGSVFPSSTREGPETPVRHEFRAERDPERESSPIQGQAQNERRRTRFATFWDATPFAVLGHLAWVASDHPGCSNPGADSQGDWHQSPLPPSLVILNLQRLLGSQSSSCVTKSSHLLPLGHP